MDYKNYKEEIKTELSNALEGRGHTVDIQDKTTYKPNVNLDGFMVTLDGKDESPITYMEEVENLSESGMTTHDIVESLADRTERFYENIGPIKFNPQDFNKEFIKENAYLGVVNTEINREFLAQIPHEEIPGTDLSVFARAHVADKASITITNDHAFEMGMTASEVIEVAKERTMQADFSVKSMEETITEMMPEGFNADGLFAINQEEKPTMMVITNESKIEGANAIIVPEVFDEACEKMGCSEVVILPSSRHELIAVNPENMGGMRASADFKEMVEEVNRTEVSRADFLSDSIYKYDSATHELTMCNEKGIFPETANMEKGLSVDISMK